MWLLYGLLMNSLLYSGLAYDSFQEPGHAMLSAKRGLNLIAQSSAHWANMSMQFQQFQMRDLFSRQETCPAGYGTSNPKTRPR
jgi:hypothetical protein